MPAQEPMPDQLPAWFANMPVGRQMLAEKTAEREAKRKTLLAEIAALRKEQEKVLLPLAKASADAKQECEAAMKRAHEATRKYQLVEQARTSAGLRLSTAISERESRLVELADPEIDAFIREMRTLTEETRLGFHAQEHAGPLNRISYTRGIAVRHNGVSINARLVAIRAASDAAVAMQLESVDNVADRLAELRAHIPPLQGLEFEGAEH
jgi:hypothetical protein